MNYMAKVAKMLGMEPGERFKTEDDDRKYWLDERGINCEGYDREQVHGILEYILTDRLEIIKLPWKPKDGEQFYSIRRNGAIDHFMFFPNHPLYIAALAFGNCFRTKAEAEAHKDEMLQKMKEVLEV